MWEVVSAAGCSGRNAAGVRGRHLEQVSSHARQHSDGVWTGRKFSSASVRGHLLPQASIVEKLLSGPGRLQAEGLVGATGLVLDAFKIARTFFLIYILNKIHYPARMVELFNKR